MGFKGVIIARTCFPDDKKNPRIKTITFEIDKSNETELEATAVQVEAHANNNLYPAYTKKEMVALNEDAATGIKEDMMELNHYENMPI